jgi:hypothetical protein
MISVCVQTSWACQAALWLDAFTLLVGGAVTLVGNAHLLRLKSKHPSRAFLAAFGQPALTAFLVGGTLLINWQLLRLVVSLNGL